MTMVCPQFMLRKYLRSSGQMPGQLVVTAYHMVETMAAISATRIETASLHTATGALMAGGLIAFQGENPSR